MSGIVGIVHLDGKPVIPDLLRRLTHYLSFRGPDGNAIWAAGQVGFGHAQFKTAHESEGDRQPFTLGHGLWIVADARIDGRRDLIRRLKPSGSEDLASAPDAELILRAYELWGEKCVEYLLGDFAFAVWDVNRRRLFCARDHMGVKPFYYAHLRSLVLFSNTLDCIRRHPALSDELNDLAVADFLLFGSNQDPATTSFAEIQRLPAGHCATWSPHEFIIRRYWSMPIDDPIFYKRSEDYVERFRELLREVVSDRLRTNRIGIFMSGGVDSPTLAATARDLLAQRYARFELQAITNVDEFTPEERHYARLVARHIGIPVHFREWAHELLNVRSEEVAFRTPEPCANPWQVLADREFWRRFNSHSRVFFFGEGPDNALRLECRPYLSYLHRLRKYDRLLGALYSTLFSERRPPFWGRISNRMSGRGTPEPPSFPAWLNPNLVSRLQLDARWRAFTSAPASPHPIRPQGYASLQLPLWQTLFQYFDPGASRLPFEVRHPFVDVRMLRYLLAIPPLPWCRSKYLLRRAMRGILPEPVLRRRKLGVPPAPLMSVMSRSCAETFAPVPGVRAYVDLERLPAGYGGAAQASLSYLLLRSLNHWLQYSRARSHNDQLENEFDGFAQKS